MEYSAEHVWGLAVRAHVLNNGYVKDTVYDYKTDSTTVPNKVLLKQWLTNGDTPTQEEITKGIEYREFFSNFLIKIMQGNITPFQETVYAVSLMDTFKSNNLTELSIVSTMPNIAITSRIDNDIAIRRSVSTLLPHKINAPFKSECVILQCIPVPAYNKFKIIGIIGESSIIEFWHATGLDINSVVELSAKIKDHRDDNTTRLNYVKVKGTLTK